MCNKAVVSFIFIPYMWIQYIVSYVQLFTPSLMIQRLVIFYILFNSDNFCIKQSYDFILCAFQSEKFYIILTKYFRFRNKINTLDDTIWFYIYWRCKYQANFFEGCFIHTHKRIYSQIGPKYIDDLWETAILPLPGVIGDVTLSVLRWWWTLSCKRYPDLGNSISFRNNVYPPRWFGLTTKLLVLSLN